MARRHIGSNLVAAVLLACVSGVGLAQLTSTPPNTPVKANYRYFVSYWWSSNPTTAEIAAVEKTMLWCERQGGEFRSLNEFWKGTRSLRVRACEFRTLEYAPGADWSPPPPSIVREAKPVLCPFQGPRSDEACARQIWDELGASGD